jgi:hypothetical protein
MATDTRTGSQYGSGSGTHRTGTGDTWKRWLPLLLAALALLLFGLFRGMRHSTPKQGGTAPGMNDKSYNRNLPREIPREVPQR